MKNEKCLYCSSDDIEVACMGWTPAPDPNRRTCLKCKNSWYAPERMEIILQENELRGNPNVGSFRKRWMSR